MHPVAGESSPHSRPTIRCSAVAPRQRSVTSFSATRHGEKKKAFLNFLFRPLENNEQYKFCSDYCNGSGVRNTVENQVDMAQINGNGLGGPQFAGLSDPQKLFIDGKLQSSSDGSVFQVKNPMTGQAIYECVSATTSDYNTAIAKAHDAFQTWSRMGPSARRVVFLRAADIMETYLGTRADEILASEVSATKSWVKLNIMATVGVFRETAGLATHIKGEIVPADRPGTTILIERQAVGVVFAISPWNAPVSVT